MKKRVFYAETAYIVGVLATSLAPAMMAAADFGVSMVVAPAYLLHLKLSQTLPWVTYGRAEMAMEVLVIATAIALLRKFRLSLLFSFVTALLSSSLIDAFSALIALFPAPGLAGRIALYVGGLLICGYGVACMFHTYISAGAYDLFVKEVTAHFRLNRARFKLGFDIAFCAAGIAMSFAFFGLWRFEGVKAGTIVCAFVNGPIIAMFSRYLEKRYEFRDRLKLRRYFEDAPSGLFSAGR